MYIPQAKDKKPSIQRGQIYYADLGGIDNAVGSEQAGVRPVLVVQNDVGNRFSETVIVAPLTSAKNKHHLPTHCQLDASEYLRKPSTVLLEQLRTVSKKRLDAQSIGCLSKEEMERVDKALSVSVGLIQQSSNDTLS